jgi:ABC-type taurine transport system substrate-binding protein
LITSGELAKVGAPTFDAWIVRKDFADKHPEVVKAFAKTTLDATPRTARIQRPGWPMPATSTNW